MADIQERDLLNHINAWEYKAAIESKVLFPWLTWRGEAYTTGSWQCDSPVHAVPCHHVNYYALTWPEKQPFRLRIHTARNNGNRSACVEERAALKNLSAGKLREAHLCWNP
jgi:hypothetical protein